MIKFTIENDDGEEVVYELPSKMEVCSLCGGHGTHLMPGLQGHAFTREEFEDTFDDDEDREQYFTRGGRYDVTCQCCHGKNVIEVIDEPACQLKPDWKEGLKLYHKKQQDDADYNRLCEAERRMGA
jgi:DnaJ-class molecular chaperone